MWDCRQKTLGPRIATREPPGVLQFALFQLSMFSILPSIAMRNSTAWIRLLSLIAPMMAGVFLGSASEPSPSPLDDWRWRFPLPQGNDLAGAAFGAGVTVVVGATGTILTSHDGVHWHGRHEPRYGSLIDVHFADGRFVAVGVTNTILTSTDGQQWRDVTPLNVPGGGQEFFTAIAYGGGTWVIIGYNGFFTSTDGIHWKRQDPVLLNARDITFGDGKFLALGRLPTGTAQLAVSTNGISWSLVGPLDVSAGLTTARLDYFDGRFVVVSDTHNRRKGRGGAILSLISRDGIAWEAGTPDPEIEFRDVAIGPGIIIAVGHLMSNGSDDDRARILRSVDGLHWTTNSVAPGNNLSRVVRLPDRFIALGDDGNFWSSETGEDWVSVAAASDINLQCVAEGGGRVVALGDDNQVLISESGGEWRVLSSLTGDRFRSVVYGRDAFVAVVEDGKLLHSVDGVDWNVVLHTGVPVASDQRRKLYFADGLFVALGVGAGVFVSSDGRDWVKVVELPPTLNSQSPAEGAHGGGHHVVTIGFDFILTSVDGRNWRRETAEFSGRIESMTYGNGRFVVRGSATSRQGGGVFFSWATSPDGVHWTPRYESSPSVDFLAFEGGQFVGGGPLGTVFSSEDGSNWIPHQLPTGNRIRGLLFTSAGTILAVGSNRAILESGPLLPSLRALGIGLEGFRLEMRGWPGQEYILQTRSQLTDDTWRDAERLTLPGMRTNLIRSDERNTYFRLINGF